MSVSRVFKVLDELSGEPQGLAVSELIKRTGVARASLSRLLADLTSEGVIRADAESGQYLLNIALWKYGVAAIDQLQIRSISWPHLAALSQDTLGYVNLMVRVEDYLLTCESLNTTDRGLTSTLLYRRSPLLASVGGRVITAYLTDSSVIERQFDTLGLSEQDILREFETIRSIGYGMGAVSSRPTFNNFAVPIFDKTCEPVAAISIPRFGPLDDEFMGRALPLAMDTSHRISAELGYDPSHLATLAV